MATPMAVPAALLFTQQELGGPVVENESYPVANTTEATAINGAGDRVGLLMFNLGSNPVYVGLTSAVSATAGVLLAANGGFIAMNVRDDFTLPSRQWNCISTGGTSQMYVLELLRFTTTQAGAI